MQCAGQEENSSEKVVPETLDAPYDPLLTVKEESPESTATAEEEGNNLTKSAKRKNEGQIHKTTEKKVKIEETNR